jgi:FCS type zinc finger protein
MIANDTNYLAVLEGKYDGGNQRRDRNTEEAMIGAHRPKSEPTLPECWHCGEEFEYGSDDRLQEKERGFCSRECADEYAEWLQEARQRKVSLDVIRRERAAAKASAQTEKTKETECRFPC